MRINKLFFVFALLVVFSCGSKDEEVLVGDWANAGDFDGSPRSGATCFVIGNTAYIGLGYNADLQKGMSDLWVRTDGGGWKPLKTDAPFYRHSATSFVLNGKAYIGLGVTEGKSYQSDFWEFNPVDNTWRQVASLKDAQGKDLARHGAAGIGFEGKGYVVGGKDNENVLKDVWEFTPPTESNPLGSWKAGPSYTGSKRSGASLFVVNDKMYLFGGRTGNGLAYDFHCLQNGEWTKLREIRNANTTETFDDDYASLARQYASVFTIDKKVYVALGDANGGANNSTYEYHPDSDLWYKKTIFEGAWRTEGIGFSLKDANGKERGFVGLGVSGSSRKDDIWEFFPWRDRDDTNNY